MGGIIISEDQVKSLLSKLVNEGKENINPSGLKFGNRGDSVEILQQKLMNLGLLKTKSMKPTGYFGPLTNAALTKYNGNSATPSVQRTNPTPQQTASPCDVLTVNTPNIQPSISAWKKQYPTVDTLAFMNRQLTRLSSSYQKIGIPQRTACEIAYIQIRPEYMKRYSFILDTSKTSKLIYLFDSNGKFIAKSFILSGMNVQSNNAQQIARSLLSWGEQVRNAGFKVVGDQWVDATGKNRKYSPDIIYAIIKKNKSTFLPKGIYVGGSMSTENDYVGGKNNLLLMKPAGKNSTQMAQAIHGYYIEKPRTVAMNAARKLLNSPTDPNVTNEFLNALKEGKINLSQSYGCINLPPEFITYIQKYGPNSFIFNISEDKTNYLVDNTVNYINKMSTSVGCPSPESLGARSINNIA
jgi:hypothetical protein